MKDIITILLVCFSLVLIAPTPGYAIEGFKHAKLKNEVKPKYPIDRFSDSSEVSMDDGLIDMIFVINVDGSVSAPMVVRTSMAKFVEPTLSALLGTTYEPATINGEPVISAIRKTFLFDFTAADINDSRGGRASFVNTRENGFPNGYQSFITDLAKKWQSRTHRRNGLRVYC